MSNFTRLDNILRNQASDVSADTMPDVYAYARGMAEIENVIAVVSDLVKGTSRIFNGKFGERLGTTSYNEENSIWEQKILSLMPEYDLEQKYIAELRFFH